VDFGAGTLLRTLPNGRRAGREPEIRVVYGLDPDRNGSCSGRVGVGSPLAADEAGGEPDDGVRAERDALVPPEQARPGLTALISPPARALAMPAPVAGAADRAGLSNLQQAPSRSRRGVSARTTPGSAPSTPMTASSGRSTPPGPTRRERRARDRRLLDMGSAVSPTAWCSSIQATGAWLAVRATCCWRPRRWQMTRRPRFNSRYCPAG
jgi:hypothetical protein